MLKTYLVTLLLVCAHALIAQSNFYQDRAFFQGQMPEYQAWLEQSQLAQIAKPEAVEAFPDRIVLWMRSNYTQDGMLQFAWRTLQNTYQREYRGKLGEKMLDHLAFLLDVGIDSLEIRIVAREFRNVAIRIYYQDYVHVDEDFRGVMSGGDPIQVPLTALNLPRTSQKIAAGDDQTVKAVRQEISRYVLDYYRPKGTVFYNAQIDTTRSYYNKFVYRITCLNKEIIQDGYFEFIQFKVEVQLNGKDVEVRTDIQAKYASGILCPHLRDKFYKSMDAHYPKELEDYCQMMRDKIDDHLRQRR